MGGLGRAERRNRLPRRLDQRPRLSAFGMDRGRVGLNRKRLDQRRARRRQQRRAGIVVEVNA